VVFTLHPAAVGWQKTGCIFVRGVTLTLLIYDFVPFTIMPPSLLLMTMIFSPTAHFTRKEEKSIQIV